MTRRYPGATGRSCRLLVVTATTIGMWACQPAPLCPDVYSNVAVSVPAGTYAPFVAPFPPINAATAAGATGTTVSISSNQGTVSFGGRGPFQAFLYSRTLFPAANSIVYTGLGVETGTWYPFFLYCSADGRLTRVYGEMTDRDVAVFDDVDGTCTDQGVAFMSPVSLAANTLSPVALTCGFSVHGPGSSIDLEGSQNGSVTFLGSDSIALPFHTVDCRTDCGTPGWYELHTIVWNRVRQEVGFEIIYLNDTGVTTGDGIELPDGTMTAVGPFSGATWSLYR
jgi:hypothetical protein